MTRLHWQSLVPLVCKAGVGAKRREAGQQVGYKPMSGRATRVGVVAQANQFCAVQRSGVADQRAMSSLRSSSEDNYQIFLAAKRVAQMWRVIPSSYRRRPTRRRGSTSG